MNVREICERVIGAPNELDWLSQDYLIHALKGITDEHMKLGNIVRIEGDTLYIGDIHGDIDSMLSAFGIVDEAKVNIAFMGDVVDRGSHNLECVNLLLARCFLEPERVFYIRGNHEFKEINTNWGFADAVMERYSSTVYWLYNAWFSTLPLAVLLNDKILALHGGIGKQTPTLKSIENLDRTQLPAKDDITALLWNDPSETAKGFEPNTTRGIFYNFGRDIFDDFMAQNNLDLMVRAHEKQPDGVKYYFDKRLISVFSSADHYKDTVPKAVLINEDGGQEEFTL